MLDPAADEWIRQHVTPLGSIEPPRVRPWSTVARLRTTDGIVWFKACAPVQDFEPRLTAQLFHRWPDRMPRVLGLDEGRAWLLLADAGTPVSERNNSPETWLHALPAYAELQRGETHEADAHLAHGVPDLRVERLPAGYAGLFARYLPISADARNTLRAFEPTFALLCEELAAHRVPASVQHDDLHHNNLYVDGDDVAFSTGATRRSRIRSRRSS